MAGSNAQPAPTRRRRARCSCSIEGRSVGQRMRHAPLRREEGVTAPRRRDRRNHAADEPDLDQRGHWRPASDSVASTVARRCRKYAYRILTGLRKNDDPVGSGLVGSLAHPGGNVTGLTSLVPGLAQKYVELLRDALPLALWTEFDRRRLARLDDRSRRSRDDLSPTARRGSHPPGRRSDEVHIGRTTTDVAFAALGPVKTYVGSSRGSTCRGRGSEIFKRATSSVRSSAPTRLDAEVLRGPRRRSRAAAALGLTPADLPGERCGSAGAIVAGRPRRDRVTSEPPKSPLFRPTRIAWRSHEIRLGSMEFRGEVPRNSAHRV